MILINSLLQGDFASAFAWIIAVVIALTVHEYAHAKVADLVGDPTARNQGRVTLNPLAHYDPLGTTLFLLGGIGWGKPVPVNPRFFRKPRRDEALVSLAGAGANILTACLFAQLLRFGAIGLDSPYFDLILFIIQLNLLLAVFNLIPIHPLDGSHVLLAILPPSSSQRLQLFFARHGMILLMAFIGLLWIFPPTRIIIWLPMGILARLFIGIPF